ncbi:carboxypeptidase-like regulatory domain-containing protein [Mucilaginibacter sp. AW1-3]
MFCSFKSFSVKASFVLFTLIVFSQALFAQAQPSAANSVKTLISKIDDYNAKMPGEKLYLQFDKPYYSVGDTIWFKGYILNQSLSYSPLSSRVYIDMVNDSNKVVKRYVFASAIGLTWGNITLDDKVFYEGAYTLRAYTQWMRNFGEESFFYKSFYLANADNSPWIVSTDAKLSEDIKNSVTASVKFTSVNREAIDGRTFDVKLLSGKKVLFRNNLQTGDDGIFETNFVLPATPVKNLTMVATDKKNSKKTAVVPVKVDRAQDIDIQFMPEGGQLVASLPTMVGFKAIGEDGHGVNVKGEILNKEGETAATFESSHKGMGVFNLVPQPGEVYTAKITLANGDTKTVNLPVIKQSGTVMRVKNNPARDTVDISFFASGDMVGSDKTYHFIAESRGVVCYAASLDFKNNSINAHIPKADFPTGIAHLTLLNQAGQPINERLVFINHNDNLKIDLTTQKSFTPRDSIPVRIKVTDAAGKPVMGSFSIAVTDNAQVKKDADNNANILTGMLLSADLKGYIEDPAYYFAKSTESAKALDVLLLTQGWIGYNWNTIITGAAKPAFEPEPKFEIKGRVTNLFNKPISNTSVILFGTGKYKTLRDTTTNADGVFTFNRLPLIVDSTKYVLTAHTKRGRTIQGGITVNEVELTPLTTLYGAPVKPWYVNTDSTLLNYVKTNNAYRYELDKIENGGTGRLLNTVNIKDQAAIKGSQNLNGAGTADQTLTTADMENAGKASLYDVIAEKVKGFHTGYSPRSTDMGFFIKDKRVRFVIDGLDLDRFYQPSNDIGGPHVPNEHYEYIKQTLDYLTAEDLLGIEVLYSAANIANYNTQNLTNDEILALNPAGPRGSTVAYLEITTRSGNGAFMRRANGVYVYKPRTLTLPKEFYSPKYTVKNQNRNFNDLRSTIYWNQNIVTDKSGRAKVMFYAADKPTTYTLVLEGGDMNGKIGLQTDQITISGSK